MKILTAIFILACAIGCGSPFESDTIQVRQSSLHEQKGILASNGADSYAIVELGREREYTGYPFEFDAKKGCYRTILTLRGTMSASNNCVSVDLYPDGDNYSTLITASVNGVFKVLDPSTAIIGIVRSEDGKHISMKWDGKTYESQHAIHRFPFAGLLIAKIKK